MIIQNPVHCKASPFDLYIGRPNRHQPGSKWANPFKVDKKRAAQCKDDEPYRLFIILQYAVHLVRTGLYKDAHELEGLILACWCAPRSCHGDVLVRIAGMSSKRARRELQKIIRHCVGQFITDDDPIKTKLAVVGSSELYEAQCDDSILTDQHTQMVNASIEMHPIISTSIMHANQTGTDTLVESWATSNDIPTDTPNPTMPPSTQHNAMLKQCGAFVAMWDGTQNPTRHFISKIWDDRAWIVWIWQVRHTKGFKQVYFGLKTAELERFF